MIEVVPQGPPPTADSSKQVDQDADVLHMDVQADEDDCMAAMGYAHERHPWLRGCELAVSPRVNAAVASESIKMLFMFSQLRQLQLRFDFDDCTITQQMVCAVAELLQLTSLHLLHGALHPEVDLSYLSSLRSLCELKLLPGEEGALSSLQVQQLTGLSSSLTSLAIRPHPGCVCEDSLWHLMGMTQLQELSLCPLPEPCTALDLQQLLEMPRLQRLQLGMSDAKQVLMLTDVKMPPQAPHVSLLVRDACEPGPAADVMTVISWTLSQQLTALSIGPLAAPCPNDVLVTLATLTNLQSLQVQLVAPPGQHVTGTVELLTLAPCRQLTCLEVLTSSRLYMPFSLKTVSLATLAWPRLAVLKLSLAGRREAMPEALDMCDNFTALRELQLFSPLEDVPLEEVQAQVSAGIDTCNPSASGGWVDWAAAGLSSLGLLSGGTAANTSSGNSSNPGAAGNGLDSSAGAFRRSSSGISSPLQQHWHQQDLVQRPYWKQHEIAHQQHLQEQHHMHEAASAHSQHLPCATLQDKQLLPAAVGSFQHHKVMRAGSLFRDTASSNGPQHGRLESQDSGMQWSPTWLLKSFMPFGSPASPSARSAADSLASDQQQPQGSWGLLGACRGGLPHAVSLESTALWPSQRQNAAPSRLQRSSTSAYVAPYGSSGMQDAARRASHAGGEPLAAQQGSPSQVAAPGLDLAMYRASGLLLPLNLNYMPRSLTKLCLRSYHLVAIGMPEPAVLSGSCKQAEAAHESQQERSEERQEQRSAQQHGGDNACVPAAAAAPDVQAVADVPQPAQDHSTCARDDRQAVDKHAHAAAASAPRVALPQLPLPHLLHLELDGCRIDNNTFDRLLKSSPALRALEIAGLEGLTDAGLSQVSSLQHLTRLCVEAEDTTGITLNSLTAVQRLRNLRKLHFCSRDSLHGPLDTDLLTAQLSGLTGLRQLVLLVAPDSEAYVMSGWCKVLQRRLPLCRLVLRRELLQLDSWGDVPAEAC